MLPWREVKVVKDVDTHAEQRVLINWRMSERWRIKRFSPQDSHETISSFLACLRRISRRNVVRRSSFPFFSVNTVNQTQFPIEKWPIVEYPLKKRRKKRCHFHTSEIQVLCICIRFAHLLFADNWSNTWTNGLRSEKIECFLGSWERARNLFYNSWYQMSLHSSCKSLGSWLLIISKCISGRPPPWNLLMICSFCTSA